MTSPINTPSPKVQLVFYKGYLQALEDLSDQVEGRTCAIEEKILRLQDVISAESAADQATTTHVKP